ncbi:MAG: hypothetical protein ACK4F5_02225 [Aliihoeflea sp.]
MHAYRDVHRVIEYRRNFAKVLALSLGGLCLSLFIFVTGRVEGWVALATWVLLVAGGAGLAWAGWRTVFPGRPMLALYPQGLIWNAGSGEVPIPWSEVQGIDTVSYTVVGRAYGGSYEQRLKNITMVLVSRDFYDARIDPGSDFKRGPYWDWLFRPQGEFVQVALVHDIFGVSHSDVRGPIEARWKAFREADGQHAPQPAYPAEPLRLGGGVNLYSSSHVAMVAVPLMIFLVLVGNMAGVWETPGQKNTGIQAEERAARDSELNASIERHRQAQEALWERFEESRQRMDRMVEGLGEPDPADDASPP